MIDVYYPFFEREANWHELRYSLRSIEKHFKFDFRVVITGDLPSWINPDSVLHIPHQRIEGIVQNTLYDAITKQLLFCQHPLTSSYFIRMYDDIYLLGFTDPSKIFETHFHTGCDAISQTLHHFFETNNFLNHSLWYKFFFWDLLDYPFYYFMNF